MTDKLDDYHAAKLPLPAANTLWPLFGAGFENLGIEGKPTEILIPNIGPKELLVRHDAVGICFSDIKVIRAGEEHPRIDRNMRKDPVVLGHEVSMTVVRVGKKLKDQYKPGDRFIVQADIFIDGKTTAYGYEIPGGFSQYNVIDQRVLNGDHGNYLIPVKSETGYAESALAEPWACVIAAYNLAYRTQIKAGGTTWIIGTESSSDQDYSIARGFDQQSHPARLILTQVPASLAAALTATAADLGIELLYADPGSPPPAQPVDDIILLGADVQTIEEASRYLADFGIFAIIDDQPMPTKVKVDIGRIHYNRWLYVGGSGPEISEAYDANAVRSSLLPGGRSWFVGAAGPMGRMHVQHAIQVAEGPTTILCTDVSDNRLADLQATFSPEAQAKGIELICINPTDKEAYAAGLEKFAKDGFDDIVVLAPVTPVIEEAANYLAPRGVMNIFAGVPRGTMADVNLSDAFLRDTRVIGHSASTIEDLQQMLNRAESGRLFPNRSVAAIGSLNAARAGLEAVQDGVFPGKVVIFPHIKDFPLTPLADLEDVLPTVYEKLKHGREWTNEAEQEFLRLMLA